MPNKRAVMQPRQLEPESEELIRFRETWRRELAKNKAQSAKNDQETLGVTMDPAPNHVEHQPGPSSQTIARGPTAAPLQTSHGRAIMAAATTKGHAHRHTKSTYVTDIAAVDALTHEVAALSLKTKGPGGHVATGTLANLLGGFPQDLKFEPEDEPEGVPIDTLPDEILVLILRCLHPTVIECFATVSRKARVVSLDSIIWRELVELTYKPPQIAAEMVTDIIAEAYFFDYRRMFIEHPRLRLDGVYIAVCHYIREGLSENAWINISHLITYHRYLRFLPNGQVLSLLANEEVEPQHIIPLLKPNLRMKGFFIGSWRLDDTTVFITNLVDASSKGSLPLSNAGPHSEPMDLATAPSNFARRYVFQMILTLRSRPLGRWNKLEFDQYDSVDLQSGDVVGLGLKHERAFWFSKVKSYGA